MSSNHISFPSCICAALPEANHAVKPAIHQTETLRSDRRALRPPEESKKEEGGFSYVSAQ